jgi:uncharacterized OsmC-like protein
MSDLNFLVHGESATETRFVANARHFSVIIDEPPVLGGGDLGANPVEYLLASYAGCVNVMAHIIAKELELKLNKLSIRVEGNINPDRLFGKSFEERAGFKNIELTLHQESDASPELVSQWISEIKKRCPINDNLVNPTPVIIKLSSHH